MGGCRLQDTFSTIGGESAPLSFPVLTVEEVKKLNDALMGISDTLKASGSSFDQAQQDHVASINQVASSSLNL